MTKGTTAKSPARARAHKHKMSAWESKLHKRLTSERESLRSQMAEYEAQRQALVEDPDAAEMLTDLESGDIGASVEREMDLQKFANVANLLEKVEQAIGRLEQGAYTVCASCSRQIPKARMEALPYADLCVTCQERFERRYA
ncbi:MAG: TraR/DksA family transcriptional regulator [Actinobacteria bacterium ATB1]|nr:TraR/DksA family transcriptional regulator [Actinobacteria bacterium ATB1]